jgi:ketosteroid isomerase-like protein
MRTGFDELEIRAAEREVEKALEAADPTLWVYSYTEDAVFAPSGAPTVVGRNALLELARTMKPLSSVRIRTERTEGSGNVAATFGTGTWVNGRPPNAGSTTAVRFVIVWRKESDGRWRIAQEMFNAAPPAR